MSSSLFAHIRLSILSSGEYSNETACTHNEFLMKGQAYTELVTEKKGRKKGTKEKIRKFYLFQNLAIK